MLGGKSCMPRDQFKNIHEPAFCPRQASAPDKENKKLGLGYRHACTGVYTTPSSAPWWIVLLTLPKHGSPWLNNPRCMEPSANL